MLLDIPSTLEAPRGVDLMLWSQLPSQAPEYSKLQPGEMAT